MGTKRRRDDTLVRVKSDPNLPVRRHAKQVCASLAASDVLIVIADTGSGKTTQIPQLILDNDPSACIVVTQPRRVAAVSVASRVAAERGCKVSEKVGYAVRFDDQSTRGVTRIRYVTDGVMLREALAAGPSGLKRRYSHIVIDEVHERSVNTDILLGVVKYLLQQQHAKDAAAKARPKSIFASMMVRSKLSFKVVVMSATTDEQKLISFFKQSAQLNVNVLKIPGTTHPLRTFFAAFPLDDYIDGGIDALFSQIIEQNQPGHVLFFLPGKDDIFTAKQKFSKKCRQELRPEVFKHIFTFALYADLPQEEQLKALQPLDAEQRENGRKVIFATNIAETSVTIPGIRFVIDCGLVKVRDVHFDKHFNSEKLMLQAVSKAQAQQRSGRAGRTGPGSVIRLYTEEAYGKMDPYPKPEIQRSDAATTVLNIIALTSELSKNSGKADAKEQGGKKGKAGGGGDGNGEDEPVNLRNFPLMDKIPQDSMVRALETLVLLGAVDKKDMSLTRAGELMCRLPVSPMLARSLLESLRLGCVEAMLSVSAVMSVDGLIFIHPRQKRDKALAAQKRFWDMNGDHLTMANALHTVMRLNKGNDRVEFCRDHFVNMRAMTSAISIRKQLDTLMQHGDMVGWALENEVSVEVQREIEEAGTDELVRRCLVAGFFRNIAVKKEGGGGYQAVRTGDGGGSHAFDIHPSSTMLWGRRKRQPGMLLYNEMVFTTKTFLKMVVAVEPHWVRQHSTYYKDIGSKM